MMTVGEYLKAVARMHGLAYRAMARALKVSPAVLRRWRRDDVRPSWRRIQAMTALWGGNPHVILLGTILKRYRQETGISPQEVRGLLIGRNVGRRARARRAPRDADDGQLRLPIGPRRDLRG